MEIQQNLFYTHFVNPQLKGVILAQRYDSVKTRLDLSKNTTTYICESRVRGLSVDKLFLLNNLLF